MASLNFGLTIKNYKSKSVDLANLMTELYEDKMLKQKHSANDREAIILEFKTNQEPLRNQIDTARENDDNAAYKEAMAELKELEDAKDDALKLMENEAKEYEEDLERQIAALETQKEAVDADLESLKSARDEEIKEENKYFQS